MKTLDEVIKAWSICFSDNSRSNCTGCPYADDDGEAACFNHDREDALHYLKAFRDAKQALDTERERYAEAVKNCELAENKYRRLSEGTSQNLEGTSQFTCPKCHSEFVILPESNPALTWDELKQMEGKPVWIENQFYKRWLIAYKVNREDIIFDGNGFYTQAFSVDYGKAWQAYRKERE